MTKSSDKRRPQTLLATAGRDSKSSFDFVNPPLVRGSTVLHESMADMKARIERRNSGATGMPVTYGIYGSPTHHAFFEALNVLEGGHASWALPSGLVACTIAILAFVQQGDHVLVSDSVYWPTRRFCRDTLPRYGVTATYYDPRAGAEIESLFTPTTRVLFLESPGSHTFEMQDVPRLATIARRRGAVSLIDNSWATPLYFQPLACGVDVSIHAATKYICGHSDVLLGTVTSNSAAWPRLLETIHHFGLTTSPDDVYLAHRGLHTLAARLTQHRASAERLIDWLGQQPEVERILYPALASDPGHALWQRDMSGASGLFGVVLRPTAPERFAEFVDGMQLFGRGYSWGGYESLLIPAFVERSVAPLPFAGPLFRISAGLEDADDLLEDLASGFERLRRA